MLLTRFRGSFPGGIGLSLAIFAAIAYMPLIRIIDLLVERAEPAPLPKTSLKSDQARAKVVRV
jgi:hypothetical protein